MNKAHLAAGILALVLVACSGAEGTPGPKGDPGTKGTAGGAGSAGVAAKAPEGSISLVSPRAAVVGGLVTVTLSVDGVDLAPNATVSFGAGTKVSQTVVQKRSITTLLEVAENADLGLREVTVTSGEQKLAFTGGFTVAPGLGMKLTGGKPEQGGLMQLDLTNNDAEYFDKDNFELLPISADVLFAQVQAPFIGPKDARVVLFVDPSAKPGKMALAGTNYPDEASAPLYVADANQLTVAARTPETLGATEMSKVIATPFQSYLFKYPTAVNKLIVISVTPNTAQLTPFVVGLGSSGKLADVLSTQVALSYPSTVVGTGSLVVANSAFDKAGAAADAFGFKVSARTLDAQAPIAEDDATPHSGTGGTFQNWAALPASSATVPVVLLSGELKAADTADVYRVTGAANAEVELSIFTDAPVTIALSSNVNFPNNAQTQRLTLTGKAGSVVLPSVAGANRFVRVTPGSRRGKYTLATRIRPAL